MVLKTYARLFTEDMDGSLAFLQTLLGKVPDYRFAMTEAGIEVAGIGDICLVGGDAENLAPLRNTQGPLVVDDLDGTKDQLIANGATITKPEASSETGRYFYALHPDGANVEYVQWKSDLRRAILGDPITAERTSL